MNESKMTIIPVALAFECNGRPIVGWRLNEDDSVDPITPDGTIVQRPYRLEGPFKLIPAKYHVK